MKVAVIDVGSYSCRLSVADLTDGIKILYEEGNITSLAQSLSKTGQLSEDRMEETLNVLERYVQIAHKMGVKKIKAVGTEALRRARNTEEFLQKVKERTGLEVRVIKPEEEGKYAFWAVAYSLKPEGRFCIVDQGGASTEIVCGRGFEIDYLHSLPIGIVGLTEEFLNSDPPTIYELESLKNFLDEQIRPVVQPCQTLVGLGGTITTLCALQYGVYPYDPTLVHGKKLTIQQLMFWIEQLSSMRAEDRVRAFPQIEPKRSRVIVAGAVLFYRIMLLMGHTEIVVSDS